MILPGAGGKSVSLASDDFTAWRVLEQVPLNISTPLGQRNHWRPACGGISHSDHNIFVWKTFLENSTQVYRMMLMDQKLVDC